MEVRQCIDLTRNARNRLLKLCRVVAIVQTSNLSSDRAALPRPERNNDEIYVFLPETLWLSSIDLGGVLVSIYQAQTMLLDKETSADFS